jgi:hypothetical protein
MSALDFGAGTQTNPGRHYTVPAFGLPDGDWCIGCWIRTRTTNSGFSHAISHTNASTAETVRMSYWDPDYLASVIRGAGAAGARTLPAAGWATPQDNTPILWITQRKGANDEVYIVHKGATVTAPTASDTHYGTSIAAPTDYWLIGRGWSGGDRWLDHLGEVFFFNNKSLSAAQVQTLAAGARPSVATVGQDPLVLLPFRSGGVTTEVNLGTGGNTYDATIVDGSGFTTGDDFFTLGGAASGGVIRTWTF